MTRLSHCLATSYSLDNRTLFFDPDPTVSTFSVTEYIANSVLFMFLATGQVTKLTNQQKRPSLLIGPSGHLTTTSVCKKPESTALFKGCVTTNDTEFVLHTCAKNSLDDWLGFPFGETW